MSFSLDLSKFAEKVAPEAIENAVRKIALEAFTRVILKSPVKTGRFRGNWQVGIGDIPDGTLEVDDRAGTATISAATAASRGLKLGETIYLTNNLPYAQRLEYGWSQQAPTGMVGVTVIEMQQLVDKIASS